MTGDNLSDLRLRVEPGDGVVAALSGVLLVVPSLRPDQEAALTALLDAARSPGVVRSVARVVADFDEELIPPFCLVVEGDAGGIFALVHGEVVVEAVGVAGEVHLAGREARSWVDRALPSGLRRLTVLAQDATAGPGDPYGDLRSGVVRGGGVLARLRDDEPGAAVVAPAATGIDQDPPLPVVPEPVALVPVAIEPVAIEPVSPEPVSPEPVLPEPVAVDVAVEPEPVAEEPEPEPEPEPVVVEAAPAVVGSLPPVADTIVMPPDSEPAGEPALNGWELSGRHAAEAERAAEPEHRFEHGFEPEHGSEPEHGFEPEPEPVAAAEEPPGDTDHPGERPSPFAMPAWGANGRVVGAPLAPPLPMPSVPPPPPGYARVPQPDDSPLSEAATMLVPPPQSSPQTPVDPTPVTPSGPTPFDPFGQQGDPVPGMPPFPSQSTPPSPPFGTGPTPTPAEPAPPRSRPGRLFVDDGLDVLVDRDCVIGRNPEVDPDVANGLAKPVRLQDAEQRISRVHARLVLSDGDTQIIDAGSVNGTWIEPPGSEGWIAVPPDVPTPLPLGSRIQVGDVVLAYAADPAMG